MDGTEYGQGEPAREGASFELAPIEHEEYDALADLFLGDGEYAPTAIGHDREPSELVNADEQNANELDAESVEQVEDTPNHTTHTPILQLAQYEEGHLGHDDPGLSARQQFATAQVLESLDATDAHASELLRAFVERDDDLDAIDGLDAEAADLDDEIELVLMPDPTVEIVVLGHLPIRATLWARQYACSRAKSLGETIALIRAASGSTSVDLITDGGSVSVENFDDLHSAIDAVSSLADRVVIRVDESNEPELLDRPEIEEITVLTGADEAAVVASYRLIKTLDATLGERYVEDEGPMIRVAVMGAADEAAHDACTKLGNAVETFIQRPIEIIVGTSRIDATGTRNLYRDSVPHRAGDILDQLVASATKAHGVGGTKSGSLSVEMPAGEVRVPTPKPLGSQDQAEAQPKEVNGHALVGHEHDSPKNADGLSVMIPGLMSLETKCPKALGVEFAADEDGQLHLVVCDEDIEDAMNQLLAARAWARNNLGLLLRAESSLVIPSADRSEDSDAVMHLITMEPREIRTIFDTNVRVYSLARVRFGKVIAQVATPVN